MAEPTPARAGGADTTPEARPVRVLLVEDDEDDFLLTADLLREIGTRRFALDRVATYDAGAAALARQEHDVYLIDYRLGPHDGLELLLHMPPEGKPVIMLTGLDDPDVDLRAMRAGAADYLVKGRIDARTLERAIRYALQRHRDQEALRRLHAELEQRVRERTADLEEANRLLRDREEALREAARRKDEFLVMLAHELRNPLAPVRNALQILQVSSADRRAVEQARAMMARQVKHMTRIIDDLLDVSRLLRGSAELHPERLCLAQLVRTVLDDQRPAFDRAGLRLEAELPELPVWVNGDPTRLTQVLDNLLRNAVKFTDRGGSVTVAVQDDQARGQAVLSVRDTGAGIEPVLLPHLFEAFTQADRSLDRSKGGLGLGLSLVKGLVELHGGTVTAHSAGPGRGSEFTVRLPLVPEPAAVTAVPAATRPTAKRLRVLVVEDNRDAADSLKLLLEVFGHEGTVAYTGPAGVEAARAWNPDVILCDIGLPGLDGYGVARQLRQDPATAGTRMIAVTGYGSDEDRLRSREAGFDAHLVKPADPGELEELLTGAGD